MAVLRARYVLLSGCAIFRGMEHIAAQFGTSLDNDDFERTMTLLSADCSYAIGSETLHGPDAITGSYEANMIAGRKKLDELVWGQSRIEVLENGTCYVHFTDYLTHKGKSYTHRCKQRLEFNAAGKIAHIEHIHDVLEQDRLNAYYRSVGLPESGSS